MVNDEEIQVHSQANGPEYGAVGEIRCTERLRSTQGRNGRVGMSGIVEISVEVDAEPDQIGQPDSHVHQRHVQQDLSRPGAQVLEAEVGEGDQERAQDGQAARRPDHGPDARILHQESIVHQCFARVPRNYVSVHGRFDSRCNHLVASALQCEPRRSPNT